MIDATETDMVRRALEQSAGAGGPCGIRVKG